MKKIRLLYLSIMAAACLNSFAQVENVTSKVQNADFERGVAYWDVTFENQVWSKKTSKSKQTGFYGFSGTSLEVWNGNVLQPNSVAQTVRDLPNGTYVFGAYAAASRSLPLPSEPVREEGQSDESYKADSLAWAAEKEDIYSRLVADSVFGVKMFANNDEVRVATEHPDRGEEKRHTVKFNVATKVTDGKLRVGMQVDSTNAVYVTWDDVELYFCGDMDAEAALNEVAKLDAQKVLTIADTVVVRHMNADSLAFLNEGIAAAKAVATAADFTAADELLRWGIVMGNKSADDYKKLDAKIAAVKTGKDAMLEKIEGEWLFPWYNEAIEAILAQAETAYAAKNANRADINLLIDNLTLSYAELQFEELDYANYQLGEFIQENINQFGDGIGQYPVYWKDSLVRLQNHVMLILDNFSRETAVEDVKWIEVIENSIAACEAAKNASPVDLPAFVTQVLTGDPALGENIGSDVYKYQSETFASKAMVEKIKVTFLDTYCPNGTGKGDPVFVALSEFYLYDGAGKQIALTEENFYTNAQETSEGPMANICDGSTENFWHSDWHGTVKDNHYLEVTIPEGLELHKFSIGWQSRNNSQNIPASVELSITPESKYSALSNVITYAKSFLSSIVVGKGVGYADVDLTALKAAIAVGEALISTGATDDEYMKAAAAIEDAQYEVDMAGVVLPEEGKEYRLVSAGPFFAKQGVQKVMTAYSDTVLTDRVWWNTADKADYDQVFIFEPMENEDDKLYFTVKNKTTGKYMGTPVDAWLEYPGGEESKALFETPDTVELVSLGAGQFQLVNNGGVLHAGSHNDGVASESAGTFGGVAGVYSSVVTWTGGLNSPSAWYICELSEMPLTVLVEGKEFTSVDYHFYEPVSVFTIKADKETDFDNLTFYGLDGVAIEGVEIDPVTDGFLVYLPESVSGFIFSFTNTDAVSQVEFTASNLEPLYEAYLTAVAFNPVFSDSIGHYGDATEYEAALAQAEEYFSKGATDAEVEATVELLEKAVANLKPNMPAADKTYFIVTAFETFAQNHDVPVAVYAKNQVVEGQQKTFAKWAYISLNDEAYQWRFIEVEDTLDYPVYHIQSVSTGKYVKAIAQSANLELDVLENAGVYSITIMNGTSVAVGNVGAATRANQFFHCGGHANGAGKAGNIVGWSASAGVSQWKIVEVVSEESESNNVSLSDLVDSYKNASQKRYDGITYLRDFQNTNWQALYVPFEIPYENIKDDFEVADLNDVRQYDYDDDGVKDETVIEAFKVTSGVLAANYPYLIRAKEAGEKTITVTDAMLYATKENSIDCSSVREKFTFTGTYSRLSSDRLPQGEGYYALSGGVWQPVAEDSSLGAFRFYLKVDSRNGVNVGQSNAIRMRIIGEEGTTEIGNIESADNTQQTTIIYDLQGRRVDNPSKGVYIVDGQKVVF